MSNPNFFCTPLALNIYLKRRDEGNEIANAIRKSCVVSHQRRSTPPAPVIIRDSDIESVDPHKYLGVHLNNKPNWTQHRHSLQKRLESSLPLEEAQVGVRGPLLCDSVVASASYTVLSLYHFYYIPYLHFFLHFPIM